MAIELFDKHTIKNANVVGSGATRSIDYIEMLMECGVESCIRNVRGEVFALVVNNEWVLPVFVPDKGRNQSYVGSLYSHYVSYAIEELHELRAPVIHFAAKCVIKAIGIVLRAAMIDRAVYINNWLISTNLYPGLSADYVDEISRFIADKFTGRFVVWNSINTKTTPALYAEMKSNRYIGLYGRSIWIQDKFTGLGSKVEGVIRREHGLLGLSEYTFSKEFNAERVKELYESLYISKYSRYNPMFTERFLEETHRRRLIEYQALTRSNSSIDGVLGFIVNGNVVTTPILGYSSSIPRSTGLYRILSIHLRDIAHDRGYLLHSSAGVGEFKRSRGAVNYREYRMIFPGNVGYLRLHIIRLLSLILQKVAVPIMEKRGL